MNVSSIKGLRLAVVLALALVALPGAAFAQTADQRQPVTLVVAGPEDVPLGNLARVVAVLRDGEGNPISGARILFTSPASFAGAIGEMEIGDAATNEEGLAALDYQMRIQGPNQFSARFYGDRTYQPAEESTVVVATGLAQLAQRTAGVELPVLGSWTIMAVLAGVWSVYFTAMLVTAGIPERRGPRLGPETGGQR